MSANQAKYLLTIAGVGPESVNVTGFVGEEAVGFPYWFDIEFSMSDVGIAQNVVPPSAAVLGKECRLEIETHGVRSAYSGIASEFRVLKSATNSYVVRLVPKLHHLTLNVSTRIFQRLTVPAIIEEVVDNAGLKGYFRYELKPSNVKYPEREYIVQYQETDLSFISRLEVLQIASGMQIFMSELPFVYNLTDTLFFTAKDGKTTYRTNLKEWGTL